MTVSKEDALALELDPLRSSPLFGIPVHVSDIVPEDAAYLLPQGLYVTEKQLAMLKMAAGEIRPGSKTVPPGDFVCDLDQDQRYRWCLVAAGLLVFLVTLALVALLVL